MSLDVRLTSRDCGEIVHPSRDRSGPVTDRDLTGPWVLALGALAIGVGAVAARLLGRDRIDDTDRDDAGRDDADREADSHKRDGLA